MTNDRDLKLVGRCLRSVHYDLFEWDAVPSKEFDIDVVPRAARLTFDALAIILEWELRPPIERLNMSAPAETAIPPVFRRVDVSERWTAFIGLELLHVSWSEQETEGGIQPWSVTLAFKGGKELVVALGELVDGSLSYIPDSLIVTASRKIALAYQPRAAQTPAWTNSNLIC